ncbi:putative glycoside hydrolase [Granulicatella seriolae]|uniref:Glycoside hydrolase n=1 Tax=Granulicatella seriolae TaxID=2967226 RepID=A0ABT1WK26_9LACT|nr:putative glycoside hydrolase [Granulicatella seriolae]
MKLKPILKTISLTLGALALFSFFRSDFSIISAEEYSNEVPKINLRNSSLLKIPKNLPQKLFYDSGITIPYPSEGVKGIYAQASAMEGNSLVSIIDLLDNSALNSIVIDVKDDHGDLTLSLPTTNQTIKQNTYIEISDTDALMKTLEKHQIYPIARVVAFKDGRLAHQRPDLSFAYSDGTVWTNPGGEAFINPFMKANWDYLSEVAISAAKAGFKEIQLDYVRFAEQFDGISDSLTYSLGDFASYQDKGQAQIAAITEFVAYIRDKLKPFGVKLSVDIFGYAATVGEEPGIGQNFSKMAQHVDAVSSMIYPSHWGEAYFGVYQPDLHPYEIIYAYMQIENEILADVNPAPITRPWLQAFTDYSLPYGNYQEYGPKQIAEQIKALNDSGVTEYLLWNPASTYPRGADY